MHGRATQTRGFPARWAAWDDGTAAGWAGVIAGAVYLSAQMMFVTVIRHDSPWIPLQRVAALLLGPDALLPPGKVSLSIVGFALLIHFPLAFWFGRLIADAVRRIPRAPAWIVGAACGLAIYALDYLVIGPAMFPWFVDSQGPVTIFDHVLFGVAAALSFVALRKAVGTAPHDASSG